MKQAFQNASLNKPIIKIKSLIFHVLDVQGSNVYPYTDFVFYSVPLYNP